MHTQPKSFTGRDSIIFSDHFKKQAAAKGLTARQVTAALTRPYKITPVTRYPGQWRYCGEGVAVVIAFDRATPTAITLYLDGVVTALRDDQVTDSHALTSARLARH